MLEFGLGLRTLSGLMSPFFPQFGPNIFPSTRTSSPPPRPHPRHVTPAGGPACLSTCHLGLSPSDVHAHRGQGVPEYTEELLDAAAGRVLHHTRGTEQ